MLPLVMDLARLRLALIGDGDAAVRRLAWLDEAQAADLTVFSAAPVAALAQAAGARLTRHLPTARDFAGLHLVFIADVAEPARADLAAQARLSGAIVHAEDAPALTDIHAPAVLRRGDLTIAVSTAGAAPGLAAEIRSFLGTLFGPEWHERVRAMGELRQHWRAAGEQAGAIRRLTAAQLARYGWLKQTTPPVANDHDKAINERGDGSCP
jgi:precorrin-2 dehydrogenase/sirohydrochlorin ferrochelatase